MSGNNAQDDSESSVEESSTSVSRFDVRPVERNVDPGLLGNAAGRLHAALSNYDERGIAGSLLTWGLLMTAALAVVILDVFVTKGSVMVKLFPGVNNSSFAVFRNILPRFAYLVPLTLWGLFFGLIIGVGYIASLFMPDESSDNQRLFYQLVSIPGEGVKQVVNVERTRAAGAKEAFRTVYSGDVGIHSVEGSNPGIVNEISDDDEEPTHTLEIEFSEKETGDRFRVDEDKTAANRLAGDSDMGLVVDEVAQTLKRIDGLCTYDVVVMPLDDQTETIDDITTKIRWDQSRGKWGELKSKIPTSGKQRDPMKGPKRTRIENDISEFRAASPEVQFDIAIRVSVTGDVAGEAQSAFHGIISQIRHLTNNHVDVKANIETHASEQRWEQSVDGLPEAPESYLGNRETYTADKSEIWNFLLLPGTGKTDGISRADTPLNDLSTEQRDQHLTDYTPSDDLYDDVSLDDE